MAEDLSHLPAFLQHMLGPDPVLDNPALSWSAPRPPVTLPPAEPREAPRPALAPVPVPVPVKAAAPRVPPRAPRRMPSADPRAAQGRLF